MRYRATTKVDRPTTIEGARRFTRDGRTYTDWVQQPVRAGFEFDSDLDFTPHVAEGILVIVPEKKPAPAPKPMPVPVEPEPVPEPTPAIVEPPKVVEVEEKEEADYESMDDGGFKCVHCGKVYRPGHKAEENMQKHVKREHR